MISYDAFGLDEDLMDHGVTMVTVHFVDAVLVKFGQRQQHLQGQSLGLLTVTELHCLDTTVPEEAKGEKTKQSEHEGLLWPLRSHRSTIMSNAFFMNETELMGTSSVGLEYN